MTAAAPSATITPIRTTVPEPDAIFRLLKRLGWSVGGYDTAAAFTAEFRRGVRVVLAAAPNPDQAWPVGERTVVGHGGGGSGD